MHTIHDKAKLLARVSRIQGQAAALAKHLEEEADCDQILQLIAAIRGAANGLLGAVLEGHLVEHVVNQPDQEQRQKDVQAVLQTLKSYMK